MSAANPCNEASCENPSDSSWQKSIERALEKRPGEGITASLPYNVHFLMIDKCNAKCIMCGGDYFRKDGRRRITLDSFKTMTSNLHLEYFRSVTLAGAGDPLLNPDFVPIIHHLRDSYPHVGIQVTTNGIACAPDISREMVTSRVGSVNFSINAATRQTYARMMQVDLFDRVVENARALTRLNRELRGRIFTQFSIPINRLNIHELPLLVELAHEIHFHGINVFYTRFYPDSIRHLNIDSPENRLLDEHSLFYDQATSDSYVRQSLDLAKKYGISFTHEPLFGGEQPRLGCQWHEQELMVGFDGEVYPCGGAEVHMKEKVEGGIYCFGNVLREPLERFWNGDAYRALRISSKRSSLCLVPECRDCANMQQITHKKAHIMDWDNTSLPEITVSTKEALVSVIVPTFNRPDLLRHTIESILSQTLKDFEIIVVNDCGEGIENVLAEFNERAPIVYTRHARNRNLAAARNTGLALARGIYIAYLDDDDSFYPDHLETTVKYLQSTGESVVYTDAYRAVYRKGDAEPFRRELLYSMDFDYDAILLGNLFPVLCMVHARSCIEKSGTFDEEMTTHEDWDMWIRLSRHFKMNHIARVTAEYRFVQQSDSMTNSRIPDFLRTRRLIYQKYEHLVEERPELIRQQRLNIIEHELSINFTNPLSAFLDNVIKLVEEGDNGSAVILFDRYRRRFPLNIPEMVPIDRLMEKVRMRVQPAAV